MKTRTICGHKLTLTSGERYRAGRPMAARGMTTFPVTIERLLDGSKTEKVAEIPGLSYDEANRFLARFYRNTPEMSFFTGRVW